jgi:hypothetical protein
MAFVALGPIFELEAGEKYSLPLWGVPFLTKGWLGYLVSVIEISASEQPVQLCRLFTTYLYTEFIFTDRNVRFRKCVTCDKIKGFKPNISITKTRYYSHRSVLSGRVYSIYMHTVFPLFNPRGLISFNGSGQGVY